MFLKLERLLQVQAKICIKKTKFTNKLRSSYQLYMYYYQPLTYIVIYL